MKIRLSQLRSIIKEEVQKSLTEAFMGPPPKATPGSLAEFLGWDTEEMTPAEKTVLKRAASLIKRGASLDEVMTELETLPIDKSFNSAAARAARPGVDPRVAKRLNDDGFWDSQRDFLRQGFGLT